MGAQRTKTGAKQRDRSQGAGRPGRGTGAGRSPSSVPASGRRRGLWLIAAVVAVVITVAATVAITMAMDDGQDGALAERTAELEAQQNERHIEQVGELIQTVTDVHGQLVPVMAELHAMLPTDDSPAQPATEDEVAALRESVANARDTFGEPESATTEFNTARSGFELATELLSSALLAYESALSSDGQESERLEQLAADLRMNAVDAWSVAATQLDLLSIEAEYGHVHLYLPTRPGDDVDFHH